MRRNTPIVPLKIRPASFGHIPGITECPSPSSKMLVQVPEKAFGGQIVFPYLPAFPLEIQKLPVRERVVKCRDYFAHAAHLLFVHPHTIVLPVDLRMKRQHTVGIHEHRNAATTKRLVKAVGEIPAASRTEDVIASHRVLHVFLPDLLHFLNVDASLREQRPSKKMLSYLEVGLYQRARRQETQDRCANGPIRFP